MQFSEYRKTKTKAKNSIGIYKRNKTHIYIVTFLIMFQCAVISGFSAQVAESSSKLSESTGRILFKIFSFLLGSCDEEKFEVFHIILRKAAHFYNFAVVGALIFCLCRLFEMDGKETFFILFSGVAAAVCDEGHQYFVPGRSAQISDVLIDFSGVLFGAAILYLLLKVVFGEFHIKEKSKK